MSTISPVPFYHDDPAMEWHPVRKSLLFKDIFLLLCKYSTNCYVEQPFLCKAI